MSYLVRLSAVIPPLPAGVTHLSTDWEVATDIGFTNIIASSYDDTTNLSNWYVIVNATPPLYGRSRIKTTIGTIDWSEPQLCLTDIEAPTITIVGDPDDIPIDPIVRTTPFISTVPGDTHVATDWIVTDMSGTIIWSSTGDNTNLTSIRVPAGYLSPNTTYRMVVRYIGSSGQSSPYSVKEFTVSEVTVRTPDVAVEGYPTSINSHPKLTTSPFLSSDPTDTHVATNWIVEDINGNIVFESLANTIALTSITLPYGTLAPNTTYVIKAQHISSYTTSNYGTQTILTMNVVIDTPSAVIQGEPDNISTGPVITASAFTVLSGTDTHYATDWIIRDSLGNIVWQSMLDTVNLVNITVPLATLNDNEAYGLEIRYHGTLMSSQWYQKPFTTASVVIDAPVVTIQGEPNLVPLGPQITTGPFVVLSGADIHQSTDWIIEDTTGTVVWQSLNDTVNLTSIQVPNNTLSVSTSYAVKVRHNGLIASSPYTVKNIITTAVVIDTPTLTVQGAPNAVPTGPLLSATPFTVSVGTDTHQSTDWIIEDTTGTVVWQSLNDTVNLTSIQVPTGTLGYLTTYVFKVIYRGASGSTSSPGTVTATTISSTVTNPGTLIGGTLPIIQTPSIAIQGEPTSVPTGPQITGSAFTVLSGTDSHYSTDWIIKETVSGTVIWASLNDTVNLTSIQVPVGTLNYSTDYTVFVKYYGNVSESDWVVRQVTTVAVPVSVNQWYTTTAYPFRITSHSQSAFQDGSVLVVGGVNSSTTPATSVAECYRFNPVTATWVLATTAPQPVYYHTQSTLSDGRVLVVGGRDAANVFNTVYIYDPTTNTWTPKASYPTTIFGHRQVTLNDGRVLVVGGLATTTTKTAACYIYDPTTNTWSPVANYPIAISNTGGTVLPDGRVLIVGGEDSTGASVNNCYLYDPTTNTWTPVANYPTTSTSHIGITTMADGRVLAVGGRDAATSTTTNNCNIYDPTTDTWTAAANYPIAIDNTYPCLYANSDRILVVGGYDGTIGVADTNYYVP